MKQHATTLPLSAYLSMLAGPWLIFASTAIVLFLKNQQDLAADVSIVLPFVLIALLVAALCFLCIKLSMYLGKLRLSNFLIWTALLIIPFFWIYQLGLNTWFAMRYQTIWLASIGCIVFVAAFLLRNNAKTELYLRSAAFIAIAFIALDLVKLASTEGIGDSGSQQLGAMDEPAGQRQLPNIYHFVMDEYQTELFSNTVTPELEKKLGGFVMFSNNTSVFGRTEMSLPSMFLGKNYDFKSPPIEFQQSALAKQDSYLHTLNEAGYSTSAVMHPVFDFKINQFDSVLFHKSIVKNDPSEDRKSLVKLWVFSVLPTRISSVFLADTDADQLRYKNLLSTSAPNISYNSSKIMMANEKNLPANGRYQLLHLLIPHFPHTLSSNCEFGKEYKTSPKTHTECANKVITDYIAELKRLGRFKNSLIIVNSDHGSGFAYENGKLRKLSENEDFRFGLEYARARSRAIMMIKPIGDEGSVALKYKETPTSILDIAPTLLDEVGLPINPDMQGFDLMNDSAISNDRSKEYFFYNKRGTQGRHIIKMTRYSIKHDTYVREGLVGSGEFK